MSATARVLAMAASMILLVPVCGFASDAAPAPVADLIVTAAPVYAPLAALKGGERFPQGAQLQLVHEGKPELLVKDFAATADAQVSFDARTVLFAGKQTANAPWQIFEVALKDRSVRKVISSASDLIRPFYLPLGQLVYARRTAQGFQLERAETNGSGVLQLTYLPSSAVPTDVLQDGRILFESAYPLGSGATPELYLVYSDGSGVESFRCDHPTAASAGRWGGKQLSSGDVVFTHGATLARFTSPLAQEQKIVAPRAEYADALAETASGNWLLSTRSTAATRYALKLWKPGAGPMQTLLSVNGQNLVEPVLIVERTRPNRHPSGLHSWNYGNLLALDSRASRGGDLKLAPKSVRLETLDASGHVVTNGTAPVESDGSFFFESARGQGNSLCAA